ncbi:MAG TPA: cytochrome c3 family protein [Spirochaetota bacterium]|nr:cytochrome c3 family protein [Spirochaetota bacterium]HPC41428.1 cytochrome c3 family protein [Spirochaetota bacterium]HPL17072.1 cytochrome c3 family protein [Spirochaetota bacterium]HQF09190.1 cytochrome c3 family protein [Spirochaetota bacterium]HQH97731.1 cytochrome c3 family protein [Spirochaetota bacterium]
MNRTNLLVCCIVAVMIPTLFVSCKKKGPTDMAELTRIVSTRSTKDEMDIVHKTHEKTGIDCYRCHHKWENPDRIRNCSNCHQKDIVQITKDTCLKCHEANGK